LDKLETYMDRLPLVMASLCDIVFDDLVMGHMDYLKVQGAARRW